MLAGFISYKNVNPSISSETKFAMRLWGDKEFSDYWKQISGEWWEQFFKDNVIGLGVVVVCLFLSGVGFNTPVGHAGIYGTSIFGTSVLMSFCSFLRARSRYRAALREAHHWAIGIESFRSPLPQNESPGSDEHRKIVSTILSGQLRPPACPGCGSPLTAYGFYLLADNVPKEQWHQFVQDHPNLIKRRCPVCSGQNSDESAKDAVDSKTD